MCLIGRDFHQRTKNGTLARNLHIGYCYAYRGKHKHSIHGNKENGKEVCYEETKPGSPRKKKPIYAGVEAEEPGAGEGDPASILGKEGENG